MIILMTILMTIQSRIKGTSIFQKIQISQKMWLGLLRLIAFSRASQKISQKISQKHKDNEMRLKKIFTSARIRNAEVFLNFQTIREIFNGLLHRWRWVQAVAPSLIKEMKYFQNKFNSLKVRNLFALLVL
jgi:hypothetical protein